jgi:hypothetical protein
MQYDLTEEQLMKQETVRCIATEKLDPGASERDQEDTFLGDVKKTLEENGIFFLCLPTHAPSQKKKGNYER